MPLDRNAVKLLNLFNTFRLRAFLAMDSLRTTVFRRRVILVGVASVLSALLLIAANLTPNPKGFGTHQQLGLPPCSFLTWTGIRCPTCGMTTSWSHLLRGEILLSFKKNCGGAMFGILAIALVPACIWGAVQNDTKFTDRLSFITLIALLAVALSTLLNWVAMVVL